jgi:hypothetical protein
MEDCPNLDMDASNDVSIAEIVMAVGNAIEGCEIEEVVDQSFLQPEQECVDTLGAVSIQHLTPIGQSFIPQRELLTSVEVGLSITTSAQPEAVLTMRIREGTIDGPILATADAVFEPAEDIMIDLLHRFTLRPAITVTPGAVYVIELFASDGSLTWRDAQVKDGCPTYADGELFVLGEPVVAQTPGDFFFQTFSLADEP